MKLYTEEQVIELLKQQNALSENWIKHYLKKIPPIELPSDEEIEKEFTAILVTEEIKFDDMIEGAKWMRDKIQGGN
jgi:hypothetical protein